jgi:multidrug resistance efflux pump
MRRMILVSVLISFSILAIAGGIGYWIYNNYNYYSTDDAQVTGQALTITSTQAGKLTAFNVKLGQNVNVGDVIGTISTAGPASTPTSTDATNTTVSTNVNQNVEITSPLAGTIIQVFAVPQQNVTPGLPLVQIANLTTPTVTAYVDENTISDVKPGQQVDVHIDAYNATTYTGSVQQIVQATASQFSLLPTTGYADGNFTKVGQRIPVIISLPGTSGNALVPGMSAEVTIHLH